MPYNIRRLDLDALPFCPASGGALPDFPVVYVIFDPSQVYYVGATKSLFNRWNHHRSSWQLKKIIKRKDVKVAWVKVDIERFSDFERALIQFLKPKFNSVQNGQVYHHANRGQRKNIKYSRLADNS